MIRLKASYENGVLTIQSHAYSEDGWYIESFGGVWKLFEIPQHGGQPQFIDKFNSFTTAYDKAINLTQQTTDQSQINKLIPLYGYQ